MGGAIRTPRLLSKLGRRGRPEPGGEDLVSRHFVLQGERPGHLEAAAIGALDPFLRSLLFTDGTVTRALAAQTLAPVSVARLGQEEVAVPAEVARQLELDPAAPAIRRRVRIGIGAGAEPVLWAESHIVPERLPPGFVGLLDGAPDGIGQSLQRVALESYRELLWFGFDAGPDWAEAAPRERRGTIQRLYRVISERQAAILICESFAVEERLGTYRLAAVDGGGIAIPGPVGRIG
jgi:chorismate-pyruvate lyase